MSPLKVKITLSHVSNIFHHNILLMMLIYIILEFFWYLVLYIELLGEAGYLGVQLVLQGRVLLPQSPDLLGLRPSTGNPRAVFAVRLYYWLWCHPHSSSLLHSDTLSTGLCVPCFKGADFGHNFTSIFWRAPPRVGFHICHRLGIFGLYTGLSSLCLEAVFW